MSQDFLAMAAAAGWSQEDLLAAGLGSPAGTRQKMRPPSSIKKEIGVRQNGRLLEVVRQILHDYAQRRFAFAVILEPSQVLNHVRVVAAAQRRQLAGGVHRLLAFVF